MAGLRCDGAYSGHRLVLAVMLWRAMDGWGAVLAFKFRPDRAPGLLAQHLARQCAFRFSFNPTRLDWPHVPTPGKALVEVLLAAFELFSPISALFRCDFSIHGAQSSVTLTVLQAFRTGHV